MDALDQKRIAEVLAETPIERDDFRGCTVTNRVAPYRAKVDRIARDLERAGFRNRQGR